MSDDGGILLQHGGYEKLRAYVVAEAVYDATVVFCNRFIDKRSRTHDQMVQAARSGVRNISEGSGAAATSRKTEIKLTNVARASLNDELLKDYKSFLIQNGLRVWHKDSPEAQAMRERLRHDLAPNLPPAMPGKIQLTGLAGLASFVGQAEAEPAANAMLCAINQAAYLLRRLIEQQGREFLERGGFSERLYATRVNARAAKTIGMSDRTDQSDGSEKSGGPDPPACPECGKPMRQRMAQRGPHAGQPFWGCSGYPDCKGTRPLLGKSDGSDRSDQSDRSGRSDKGATP
ncbi:MAG TPA: four helix bundle suffix domain-containing protein [Candidatus Sumerlaeota bacterium]|nr:four helix bundle suffix domain-containing protein [Candidatus Sumerlaeota bacterium]